MPVSTRHRLSSWIALSVLLGGVLVLVLSFFWLSWPSRTDQPFSKTRYGITWSPPYARYLGISSEDGLVAALEDLRVKHVRLSTEWSSLEPKQGQFDWTDLDRHLDLLAAHTVPVTLAIGFKTPRWPECSHPVWATHLSRVDREAALRTYLTALIRHVQTRKEIVAWQVENEPFFPFGSCQAREFKDIRSEYPLVRALDPYEPFHREITVSDSGELGTWLPPAPEIDAVGVSVYRVTNNVLFGVHTYDWLPPWWYFRKMLVTRLLTGKAYYVSEFQMEPWVLTDMKISSIEEMFQTFSLDRMRVNHWELQRIGFPRVDLWGAEWWYWMKEQKNHPEFWEEAKTIFLKG